MLMSSMSGRAADSSVRPAVKPVRVSASTYASQLTRTLWRTWVAVRETEGTQGGRHSRPPSPPLADPTEQGSKLIAERLLPARTLFLGCEMPVRTRFMVKYAVKAARGSEYHGHT